MNELEKAMQAEGAAGKRFAEQHGGFYKKIDILAMIFEPIKQHLEATAPEEPIRIADVGCGSGLVGLHIEKEVQALGYQPNLIFIDSNANMLMEIEPNKDREIILADLGNLPARIMQHPVDVVLGRHFIHYVPPGDQKTILANIFNYLKPRGLFVNATGAHENPDVDQFMSDYLSSILALRKLPANRFYQSTQTYIDWMKETGFKNPMVVGEYAQPHCSYDFYERYGLKELGLSEQDVEQKINEILKAMNPSPEIERALNIKRWEGHHSVSINARVFVGRK